MEREAVFRQEKLAAEKRRLAEEADHARMIEMLEEESLLLMKDAEWRLRKLLKKIMGTNNWPGQGELHSDKT